MRIQVISLRSAVARRRSIEQQFAKIDTSFEFFDAICPQDALDHIEGYDEQEFILNCGRGATDTEIACYASHLALWRQCASGGEPFLVLEDDAQLDESFLTGLLVTSCIIRTLGFVRVSRPELKTSTVIDQMGPFHIHYCRRAPLLALGYALSPDVAARLAERGGIVEEPVDKFLQRFWRHKEPVFAVTPPFVRLSDLANESDIGERHRTGPDARLWLRRAVRKAQNSVLRTLFNALYLGKLRTARQAQATVPAATNALRVP
jgi:glycosyl transferase family 25